MYTPPILKIDINKPETFGNLAEKMDQGARRALADHVIELVKIDTESMGDWLKEAKGYLDRATDRKNVAPQNSEAKGSGEEASPPSTDLTMSAVIQFAARATGQILGEPDLARASDEDGKPLAEWVSSQLRTTDANWTVDTDPLVVHMAVTGLAWRKRAFDDYDKTFHSNFLTCDEVIINSNVKSVQRAPRITHKFERYPYEIERSISRKHWVDYEPRFDEQDPQAPKEFYEVDMWVDFDDDGADEPWTITLSRDDMPEVVRIRPRWSKKTIVNSGDVLFFKPIIRFFPYHFLPDPKGGFFPRGFGWLLYKVEASADSLLAAIDDTAKSASQNGGVMGSGGISIPDKLELKGNRVNFVPTDGRPAAGMFVPFTPKQVDAGTVTTLDKIITLGDRLAGTLNLLENAPASMTATMAKGIIDTGSQIQSAVHRRLVGSMTLEFRQFVAMADAYDMLPPEIQSIGSSGISVTADPSLSTDMQRSALAGVYTEMLTQAAAGVPWNIQEIQTRLCQVLRLPNSEALIGKPPAKPDLTPDEKMTHTINLMKARTDRIKIAGGLALSLTQSFKNMVDAQGGMLDVRAATLQVEQLEKAMEALISETNTNDTGSGANGVAGQPGDAGAGGAMPGPATPSAGGALDGAAGGPGATGPSGSMAPA